MVFGGDLQLVAYKYLDIDLHDISTYARRTLPSLPQRISQCHSLKDKTEFSKPTCMLASTRG